MEPELTGRRLGQEGLARATRAIQKNAVLRHPMLFESLGMKTVLHHGADAPLLVFQSSDIGERARRNVGSPGLRVVPAAQAPRGGQRTITLWPVADYEKQTANGDSRKNQPERQLGRRSAVAGKRCASCGVLVKQKLVDRVEPMEHGHQGEEVKHRAIGPSHSHAPGQQEKSAHERKPGQPPADLVRKDSANEQDDSECEALAREAAICSRRDTNESAIRESCLGCTGPSLAPNLPHIGCELRGCAGVVKHGFKFQLY